MSPADVHRILCGIGATHLHHANSVTTSCTFLQNGGLLSRGYVEDYKLVQTPQYSDGADKKYGIWHRIFMDHVDIHLRAGRAKGPNQYGPVLFLFEIDILMSLPAGSKISVTRKNPVNWKENEPPEKRWFKNAEELEASISFGDFDKMLVIKTASATLDFPKRTARIILDDPKRKISSNKDAYSHAEAQLKGAAAAGKIKVSIDRHQCRPDCSCITKYSQYSSGDFDLMFA